LAHGQRTIIPSFDGQLIAFLVRLLPTGLITRIYEKLARPV
jgi:hypothetical protein